MPDQPTLTHDSEHRRVRVSTQGMTCGSCAAGIEAKFNARPGTSAQVNFATERGDLRVPAQMQADEVLAQLKRMGYPATLMSSELINAAGESGAAGKAGESGDSSGADSSRPDSSCCATERTDTGPKKTEPACCENPKAEPAGAQDSAAAAQPGDGDAALRPLRTKAIWAVVLSAPVIALAIPPAALGLLHPTLAGAAMDMSSLSVLANSLRLRNFPDPSASAPKESHF